MLFVVLAPQQLFSYLSSLIKWASSHLTKHYREKPREKIRPFIYTFWLGIRTTHYVSPKNTEGLLAWEPSKDWYCCKLLARSIKWLLSEIICPPRLTWYCTATGRTTPIEIATSIEKHDCCLPQGPVRNYVAQPIHFHLYFT